MNGYDPYSDLGFEQGPIEIPPFALPTYYGSDSVDYSTAPGSSIAPGVLSQIAGGILNAIIPSAAASPAVAPAIAAGGASILGRILTGGATAAGVAAVGARQIGGVLATALFKLRARILGLSGQTITVTALASWGRRMYAQLAAWAAKNPGTSLVALLTGLGLTIEEATHVIAWGATSKRRRRSRGVTAGQMRTTRRTIGKLSSMARSLNKLHTLTGYGRPHHHHHRHTR